MQLAKHGKTVLVIAGMPGAGKSLASGVAREQGIPVFVSGDIIRAEARKRGLKLSRENLGRLMLRIRKEEGMGAVARRLTPMVLRNEQPFVLYEGARNIEELDELNKNHKVITIAIHASPETRFQRLLKRQRTDKPRTERDFRLRDEQELSVGIGRVIALADRMIENEDTKEDLRRRMKRLLRTILS